MYSIFSMTSFSRQFLYPTVCLQLVTYQNWPGWSVQCYMFKVLTKVVVLTVWEFLITPTSTAALTGAEIKRIGIRARSIMQVHVLATVLLLTQWGFSHPVFVPYTEPNLPAVRLPAVELMLSGLECRGLFLRHSSLLDAHGYIHNSLCKDHDHLERRSWWNNMQNLNEII